MSRITNDLPLSIGPLTNYATDLTLPGSGAYVHGVVIPCEGWRICKLYIDYNPAAVAGAPGIIASTSGALVAPAEASDSWFVETVTDGVVASVLQGAVPGGVGYTLAPDFGVVTHRGQVHTIEPADAAANEMRKVINLDLNGARFLLMAMGEHGVTATPGVLNMDFALAN